MNCLLSRVRLCVDCWLTISPDYWRKCKKECHWLYTCVCVCVCVYVCVCAFVCFFGTYFPVTWKFEGSYFYFLTTHPINQQRLNLQSIPYHIAIRKSKSIPTTHSHGRSFLYSWWGDCPTNFQVCPTNFVLCPTNLCQIRSFSGFKTIISTAGSQSYRIRRHFWI